MSCDFRTGRPPRQTIFGFSPIFGFYEEGRAEVRKAILGHKRYCNVLFEGEQIERVRAVFPELQDCFNSERIRLVNELVFMGASDLAVSLECYPSLYEPRSPRRKICFSKNKR